MPFFSIIVPVYNVENYIRQCLDSIIVQTFNDFEIILVDDGSTDSSSKICQEYVDKDNRICLYLTENGGASSARNYGMKLAKGDYIIFIDSDDYWYSKLSLEKIFNLIQKDKSDIIVLKYVKYFQDSGELKLTIDEFSNDDFSSENYSNRLVNLVERQLYDACPWNKIFKRELMYKNDLFFMQGIIAEDIDWAARLSLYANSISLFDEPVYVYRKGRSDSVTSKIQLRNLLDTKGSIERCLNYDDLELKDDFFKLAYYSYVAYRFVIWIAESSVVNDERKDALISQMKKYKWLFKYSLNKKVRLVKLIYNILGFKLTSKLLGAYLNK